MVNMTNDNSTVATQVSEMSMLETRNGSRRESQNSHSSPPVGKASYQKPMKKTSTKPKLPPSSSNPIASPEALVTAGPSIASNLPSLPPQNRSDLLSMEYNHLLQETNNPDNLAHFREIQLLADLCLNYEEISMKKKRLSSVPPILCRTVLEITQRLAEEIANASDFDMVEMILTKMMDENINHLSDIQYDETYVITRREQRSHQILVQMTRLISIYYQQQHQPVITQSGMVRTDARQLFFSLVRKALELFLTKHNQVLNHRFLFRSLK